MHCRGVCAHLDLFQWFVALFVAMGCFNGLFNGLLQWVCLCVCQFEKKSVAKIMQRIQDAEEAWIAETKDASAWASPGGRRVAGSLWEEDVDEGCDDGSGYIWGSESGAGGARLRGSPPYIAPPR
jgi:hypothetical protein